jgi:hypothetical protein
MHSRNQRYGPRDPLTHACAEAPRVSRTHLAGPSPGDGPHAFCVRLRRIELDGVQIIQSARCVSPRGQRSKGILGGRPLYVIIRPSPSRNRRRASRLIRRKIRAARPGDPFGRSRACLLIWMPPLEPPSIRKGLGEVSAWGSVGRTTCETAPARHRVPLYNVGHS